jgi:heme exporter protein C
MHTNARKLSAGFVAWHLLVVVLLIAALLAIGTAPMEQTMGHAQRVLYVHVSVAWLGLLGFVVMAAAAIAYLLRQDLRWDHWSQSAGELGWLSCSLTLITGSLWAHAAWGTWWTWEPRLLSSFILWALISSYLLIRSGIPDPHRRARLSGVVAVLGVLDVPLVLMATRWFRGMHPVSPEMEPSMRVVMLLTVVSFTALFGTLFLHRRQQILLEHRILALQNGVDTPVATSVGPRIMSVPPSGRGALSRGTPPR